MPQTQEEHEEYLENQEESGNSLHQQHQPDIALALNGLNARHVNSNSNSIAENIDEYEMAQADKVLEYDQSNATKNSKMLSLDQIIEFYDEHTMNSGNNRLLLSDLNAHNQNQQASSSIENKKSNKANKIKFGKKIYEFYNAPITKFYQNTTIYILFLICFAYIVLVQTPSTPSIPEIFFLVYIFTYGLDKIREVCLVIYKY